MGQNLRQHRSTERIKAIEFPQLSGSRDRQIIPNLLRCQRLCRRGVIRHSARSPTRNVHEYSVAASHDANLTLFCSDDFQNQVARQQSSRDVRFGSKADIGKVRPMSALPPKADIGTQSWNVRFVPKADSCSAAKRSLFDHLVGASKERRRYRKTEGLRGGEIDDKRELRRLLDRNVARLRPA